MLASLHKIATETHTSLNQRPGTGKEEPEGLQKARENVLSS